MPAAYDNFDYPSYWDGREYEHKAEVIALEEFLKQIPEIHRLMEIGAGYGRLTPYYEYRANQVYLVDSSSGLLKLARKRYADLQKFRLIHSKIENVGKKIQSKSMDLIIVVRVLHHVEDLQNFIENVGKYLTPGGYLILEFPNKKNIKSVLREISRGNLTYPLDIFPKDIKGEDETSIPFKNYHPDIIKSLLQQNNFEILQTRSVSNIRNTFLKKHLPIDFLLFLEKSLQTVLSYISFGPSMFILAKKTT